MTAPTNQTFVSGTTISSEWLNGVNDAINNATQDIAGSTPRTLPDKLSDFVSVKDFGAVGDGVTDDTSKVQAAMDSLSGTGGYVLIPKQCKYDPNLLTWVNSVSLIDEYFLDGYRITLNNGNPGGAVNEHVVSSGFHPSYVLDVYNNRTLGTLGDGQAYSNRASIVYRVNGTGVWQVGNDTKADGTNDFTVYRLNTSFQALTFTVDGKAIYGQMSSGSSWTGDYAHNLRGSATCIENSTGNVSLILRLNDNSRRKIIKLDTNDNVTIGNTADTEVLFTLTNTGQVRAKRGITGGAYSTTARNALAVTSADIGLMVFDSTLGKPVWLKNNTGPVWVDATGTIV